MTADSELPSDDGTGPREKHYRSISGPIDLHVAASDSAAPVDLKVFASSGVKYPMVGVRGSDAVDLDNKAADHGKTVTVSVRDNGSPDRAGIVAFVPAGSSVYHYSPKSGGRVELRGDFDQLDVYNEPGDVRLRGSYADAQISSMTGNLDLGHQPPHAERSAVPTPPGISGSIPTRDVSSTHPPGRKHFPTSR